MCMCEAEYPKETAFLYLEECMSVFFDKFTQNDIDRENAYSKFFNEKFQNVLKDKMIYFNKNQDATDNLKELKQGVLNYRENVIKANDILIERGENINLVVKKADSLKHESESYYSTVYF